MSSTVFGPVSVKLSAELKTRFMKCGEQHPV